MALNLVLGDTKLIIEEAKKAGLLRNELAYVLATAYHETAHTMKPVREYGGETYLKKKKYYPYVGMGYVQLTWLRNYELASKKLGVDFVKEPTLLLKPEYSAPILVIGMKEGWFTTKKLSDYITLQKSNFVAARAIINGKDRAADIAKLALEYDALLKKAGYGVEPTEKAVESVPPVPVLDVPAETKIASVDATSSVLNIIWELFKMWRKK